jgi:hypothetical protein
MADKVITFKFKGMNNVDDPADVGAPERDNYSRVKAYTEAVDLVNVDPGNDGNITPRSAVIAGLVFQPVTETMGSRNYWAVRNTVYCSKALNDATDERFNTIISLDDTITMIRRVDGGLYIGSTAELHFLLGTDPQVGGGFKDEWSLPYGVIMGTGCRIKGELVPVAKLSGNCCIFASHRGVIVGGPGGVVTNLSQNKVSYEYGYYGRAMVREENGEAHYVFDPDAGVGAYNAFRALNLDKNY